MSVYQGTYFAQTFAVKDADGVPVDITGWTFRAMFRDAPDDEDPLFELTTGDGFDIVDELAGQFQMEITEERSALLTVGVVHFDIMRTDGTNGDVFLCAGKLRVRRPITRDE